MIIVTGRITLKEGALKKLLPAMAGMIAESRTEKGCIDYTYGPDLSDPNAFLVYEKWANWDVLAAHYERPHLKAWRAALYAAGLVSRDMRAADETEMREV